MSDFPNAQDREQMQRLGMDTTRIEKDLQQLSNGHPGLNLERPCTIGDGIVCLQNNEIDTFAKIGEEAGLGGRLAKFVPASGAASRMFEPLRSLSNIAETLPKLAFFEEWAHITGLRKASLLEIHSAVSQLLSKKSMDYGRLPKGLLPFHQYGAYVRTPIEEHLVEAIRYTLDRNSEGRVHFTLPSARKQQLAVRKHVDTVLPRYLSTGCSLDVSYSIQEIRTDAPAILADKAEPVRDHAGQLLFWPSGHGALLSNLDKLQGDIIFIKNIDNVIRDEFPKDLKPDLHRFRKALCGYLVAIQKDTFSHLEAIKYFSANDEVIRSAFDFLQNRLSIELCPRVWALPTEEKILFVEKILNRPIRVCGVVRNEGEPGGGPFWVKDRNSAASLQIVESAQVNSDAVQQDLWRRSTHFNPVDIVCGVRNFEGKNFSLNEFVNEHTGFITKKTWDGVTPVKVLERPGLWNGSMWYWNTVFLEVPAHTFNPVKTVLDLARAAHMND